MSLDCVTQYPCFGGDVDGFGPFNAGSERMFDTPTSDDTPLTIPSAADVEATVFNFADYPLQPVDRQAPAPISAREIMPNFDWMTKLGTMSGIDGWEQHSVDFGGWWLPKGVEGKGKESFQAS